MLTSDQIISEYGHAPKLQEDFLKFLDEEGLDEVVLNELISAVSKRLFSSFMPHSPKALVVHLAPFIRALPFMKAREFIVALDQSAEEKGSQGQNFLKGLLTALMSEESFIQRDHGLLLSLAHAILQSKIKKI